MSVSAHKSQKNESPLQDRSEQDSPQTDCKMPPQQEAYIKCPRFDFL